MSVRSRRIALASLMLVAILLVAWWAFTRERSVIAPSPHRTRVSTQPANSARNRDTSPDGGVEETFLPTLRLSAPSVRRDRSAGAGVLSGRVLAYASGRPIAGAVLEFEHGGGTRTVRTDALGAFTLAPDEEGTYVLAVGSADGFLPYAPEWGHSTVRWEARRGVRVEGVIVYLVDAVPYTALVLDASRRPVRDADVRVFGLEQGERALAPLASRHRTDAQGEVELVAPDGAIVEASHPRHGRGRARIDDAAQASHRVTVTLAPADGRDGQLRIAGRVVDDAGAPIEGALVAARHSARPSSEELHPSLEATSDAEGRFVLSDADEGAYRLVVHASAHARLVRESVPAGTENLVLRLGREGRLRVRARDANGAPIAALSALVTRASGPLVREVLAVESTYDAEGELDVGGLPEGPCEVVVVAPGYAESAPASTNVRAGARSDVEVTLERGGRIEGRIVDAQGHPLAGARITLEGHLGSGSSAVPLETDTLSDETGRFALSGVREGRHSIVVWAADHNGRVRSGIDVTSGASTDVGTIDLTPVEDGERPRLELAGIGAVLSAEGDAMIVGRVIEGGGAAEVGIVAGDAVLEIDGVSVVQLGFAGSIERIRGPEGTNVLLRLRRSTGRAELVSVPRRRVRA